MSRCFEDLGFRMRRAAPVRIFACALAVLPVAVGAQAQDASKKALHIDSYHAGNEWNDRIVAALRETLTGKNIELRVFHMDTKRRSSDSDIPLSYNREGELFFNDGIARRLGIKDFPPLARAVP